MGSTGPSGAAVGFEGLLTVGAGGAAPRSQRLRPAEFRPGFRALARDEAARRGERHGPDAADGPGCRADAQLPSQAFQGPRSAVCRRRLGGARSTWQRQPATNDPRLQRPALLAHPLDVKGQRLLGVRDGFLKILALGVEPRQLRRVRVVATVRVWLEDELHVAGGLHALTLAPPPSKGAPSAAADLRLLLLRTRPIPLASSRSAGGNHDVAVCEPRDGSLGPPATTRAPGSVRSATV